MENNIVDFGEMTFFKEVEANKLKVDYYNLVGSNFIFFESIEKQNLVEILVEPYNEKEDKYRVIAYSEAGVKSQFYEFAKLNGIDYNFLDYHK